MQGDTIVIEPHHRQAGEAIAKMLLPTINETDKPYTQSIFYDDPYFILQ